MDQLTSCMQVTHNFLPAYPFWKGLHRHTSPFPPLSYSEGEEVLVENGQI